MDNLILGTLSTKRLSDNEKIEIYKTILRHKDRLSLCEKKDYRIKDSPEDDYFDLDFDYDVLDDEAKFELYDCINEIQIN